MRLLDELGIGLGDLFDLPENRATGGVGDAGKRGSSGEPTAAPTGGGAAAATQVPHEVATEGPSAVLELENSGRGASEQGLERGAGPACGDDALQAGADVAADGGNSDLQSGLRAQEFASERPVSRRPSTASGLASGAAAAVSAFASMLGEKAGVSKSNGEKGSGGRPDVGSSGCSSGRLPKHIVEEAAESVVSDVLDWWETAGDAATDEVTDFRRNLPPPPPARRRADVAAHPPGELRQAGSEPPCLSVVHSVKIVCLPHHDLSFSANPAHSYGH